MSKEDYLLPDSNVGTIWRGRFLPFNSTTKLFAEAGPSALPQIGQAVFHPLGCIRAVCRAL